MKITIYSDFGCPFCYIGETLLTQALTELGFAPEDIQLDLHSYLLDPNAPLIPVQSMLEHFMTEHHVDAREAADQIVRFTKIAARAGLNINLRDARVCSTVDAHRLVKFALEHAGESTAEGLSFALFKANFVENLRLSDRELLCRLGAEAGLNPIDIITMLDSEAYIDAVMADCKTLDKKHDFTSIPYMIFPDGSVMQGVMSIGALRSHLAPYKV